MSFLRQSERPLSMFQCLAGMLTSGEMILFAVVYGGSTMRVSG
jgi:hypothetical protein